MISASYVPDNGRLPDHSKCRILLNQCFGYGHFRLLNPLYRYACRLRVLDSFGTEAPYNDRTWVMKSQRNKKIYDTQWGKHELNLKQAIRRWNLLGLSAVDRIHQIAFSQSVYHWTMQCSRGTWVRCRYDVIFPFHTPIFPVSSSTPCSPILPITLSWALLSKKWTLLSVGRPSRKSGATFHSFMARIEQCGRERRTWFG